MAGVYAANAEGTARRADSCAVEDLPPPLIHRRPAGYGGQAQPFPFKGEGMGFTDARAAGAVCHPSRFWREGTIAPGMALKDVSPRLTEEALKVIDAHVAEDESSRKPLFLYFALTGPHTPWLPSPEFVGKSGAG